LSKAKGGLSVRRLSVERGGRTVIADLSFEVAPGQALLLTGPNGAGKTTLIRTLAGLLSPVGGVIELQNAAADDRLSEQCHYVAHTNAAKTDLTVRQNLRFWAQFMGGVSGAEEAAIADVGLRSLADIPVQYLSAGQQRRVAIGRLMVAKRVLWLLDEPTVSLDAANTARLEKFGNAHLAAGGMIVAATHIPLDFKPMVELRLLPVAFDAEVDDLWGELQPLRPGGAGA
jgi:heme exporter protein A